MAHDHQAEDDPGTCAAASLHELADADLTGEVRAEVLEHGMRAVAELRRQRAEARAWARADLNHLWPTPAGAPPAWLTEEPPNMPPRPYAEQRALPEDRVTVRTDIAAFTGAGRGRISVPDGVTLAVGDIIAVTDDECDTMEAEVIEAATVDGVATVRIRWDNAEQPPP